MGRLHPAAIYEAAYDDEVFRALPDLMRRTCDARSVVMHFVDQAGVHSSMAHTGHWSDAEVALYGSMADKDILQKASARPDLINSFCRITDDLVSPVRFRNSEIHERFYKAIGDDTRHVLGASFQTPWGMGAIGVHRGDHSTGFGDKEHHALQAVASDLKRMLIIRSKLMLHERRALKAGAVLDRFGLAILQTDADGRIVDCNAEALNLLDQSIIMLVAGDRLAVDLADVEPLRQAVRKATRSSAPTASLLNLSGSLAGWTLTVTPLALPGAPRALLVLKNPLDETALALRLQALFSLSPSEARIAVALSNGAAPADIATARGVSEHTVRSQIKALFGKTGCRRQGQLIALVTGLPPLRLD